MKILGIVGSPRKRGNTYQMIKWILDCAKENGADTEIIGLTEFNIKYCIGCSKCMIQGKCPQKDDVPKLHKKMCEADGIVFGAPSYVIHVPAQTKVFLDRSAFMCHRPQLIGKFSIAVSPSAGFGEEIVVDYLNGVLATMGATPIGELTAIAYGKHIFPEEEIVKKNAKELGIKLVDSITEEMRSHKVVRSYRPREEIKQIIKRAGEYLKADYKFWKDKGWLEETETEAQKKTKDKIIPSSCEELIKSMPDVFNPEAATGIDTKIQFIVTGKENFKGYLEIKDQRCSYYEGVAEEPAVTITTPAEIWLKIAKGELSGTTAYFTRKYKVKGDWKILTKFSKLFGK
jgi:multimeric flavodoxin WrbA